MMLAAGLITQLFVWALVWTVVGIAVGALQALCGALLAERAPAESRGQVFATVSASTRAASLVATALGGVAGTLMGPQGVFVVAGCGCLLATLLVGRRLRNAVRLPGAVSRDVQPAVQNA
jgi:MFS family permease